MTKLQVNIKDGKRVAAQHGEVWLQPIDAMPDLKTKKTKTFIVGHSETGHNHVLESNTEFEVFEGDAKHDLYVRLFEPTKLVHKKSYDIHETQIIQPGDYAVYQKTEYDPFREVVRAVFD